MSIGEKDGPIAKLFASCRRIVTRVDRSLIAYEELCFAQIAEDLPRHKLLQVLKVNFLNYFKI
jgi:hypothetical protein